VISVRHSPDDEGRHWVVKYQQKDGPAKEEHFDVLFACTGHYSVPRLPSFVHKLVGLPWLHSHRYRRAELYAGKTVAVVGAGLSGVDIALHLADRAKTVWKSSRMNS
jgi:cation diffusion facilitator CzcD-associated flavoprotein CzcO